MDLTQSPSFPGQGRHVPELMPPKWINPSQTRSPSLRFRAVMSFSPNPSSSYQVLISICLLLCGLLPWSDATRHPKATNHCGRQPICSAKRSRAWKVEGSSSITWKGPERSLSTVNTIFSPLNLANTQFPKETRGSANPQADFIASTRWDSFGVTLSP